MTFERPTRAGLAIAALGLLCVAGFAGVAFAEDAAAPPLRLPRLSFPTRAIPPGCWYPARSF